MDVRYRLEYALSQHEAGFLDESELAGVRRTLLQVAPSWEALGIELSPRMQEELDRLR